MKISSDSERSLHLEVGHEDGELPGAVTVDLVLPSRPCSHLLHLTCYQDMLAQGLYACPTCGLAMQDMSRYWRNMDAEVAATPMPR